MYTILSVHQFHSYVDLSEWKTLNVYIRNILMLLYSAWHTHTNAIHAYCQNEREKKTLFDIVNVYSL